MQDKNTGRRRIKNVLYFRITYVVILMQTDEEDLVSVMQRWTRAFQNLTSIKVFFF